MARAIAAASSATGKRTIVLGGVNYGDGCASLIHAAFAAAGHGLPEHALEPSGIFRIAQGRRALKSGLRPAPGDVVFFADQPRGAPAHVGLVSRVEPDGTAIVIHRVARGVMRLRVNLAYPTRTHDPATGKAINDTLVVRDEPYVAGSLVVGFAELL